jgi:predicted ATPase
LDEACNGSIGSDRSLLLIEGLSGTGKSALASHLEKSVRSKSGFYAMGKFDLQQIGESLSAITSAIPRLFDQILPLNKGTPGGGGRNDSVLYECIKNKISIWQAKRRWKSQRSVLLQSISSWL